MRPRGGSIVEIERTRRGTAYRNMMRRFSAILVRHPRSYLLAMVLVAPTVAIMASVAIAIIWVAIAIIWAMVARGLADYSHIPRSCFAGEIYSSTPPCGGLSVIGRYIHDLASNIGLGRKVVPFVGHRWSREAKHKSYNE
jgi:hypothetical protein